MKFAVIGDIHSNIYALENVINDIEGRNVDVILCTGDLVGYATFPNEVIDTIRKNNILSIQGNYDEAIGNRALVCGCDYNEQKKLEMAGQSVLFTNETVTDENRKYLKYLPKQLELKVGNNKLLLVHGSPRKINEYLFQNSETLTEVINELEHDILICGHTHKPYYDKINGKHIINSGSVGKPKHGNPNATYVIVEISEDNIQVEICEVSYDYEKTAKAIEEDATLPNEFAMLLREGRG